MRSADIRKDDAAQAAPKLTAGEISGVERSSQTAVELGGKRWIRYFVSYSNKDRKLKDDLLRRLEDRFAIAKKYRFEAWQDKDIELGSDWHEQIQAAISICDIGLLLVSPAFLATSYIADHELPKFVADGPFQPAARKCVAPVALKPIHFDGRVDLRGLEQRQIFRDRERRAYQQRTGNKQKDEFVDELFDKIIDMLDGHLSEASGASEASLVERSIGTSDKPDLNCLAKFSVALRTQPIKPEEVSDLQNLLRSVQIPDDCVYTLFRQILPDSRPFDLISGQSDFFSCLEFLAKKRHAPPCDAPLLEFVERCRDLIAGQLSPPVLNTFDEWMTPVAYRLDVDLQALKNRIQATAAQEANAAEPPVLLVKIAPKGSVSETEFTVTVWCRHSGKYDPAGIDPLTVQKDQLEAELQSIIGRIASRYFREKLRLETILPIALLDFRIKLPDGPYKEELGALFPIKIRSWERTYHHAYDNSRSNWLTKWEAGPRYPLSADNIRRVFNDDIDGKSLSNELKLDKKSWVLLTLFPLPKDRTRIRDIFGAPLVAGLPFVFWPLVEQLDFPTLYKELQSWLLEHPSDRWPDMLCQERKSIARKHWNDFLMLWDDPKHLPPDVEYNQSAPGE